MELRQLEMLLSVVETGGYLNAGEALHVSHSAIHRQVRLLEQEIGDRILVRVGRHMELTEAGKMLIVLAKNMRREINDTMRRMADLNDLQTGHLRIGTGTAMLVRFLAKVLRRFQREHSHIEVHTVTGTAENLLDEIQNGNLDIGIVLASDEKAPQFEQLYREEFVWAFGKRHALAGKRSTTLAQLAQLPFIAFPKSSTVRHLFDKCFERAGLTPRILMELENEEAMAEMLQLNMGVALLTRRRAVKEKLNFVALPDHSIVCPVGMVLPKQDYIPRAVREFADMCREAARGLSERDAASGRSHVSVK